MKKVGKCRICGKISQLTFEHIPPKSSGNKYPVKEYRGEQLLMRNTGLVLVPNLENLQYKNRQSGFGDYLLCKTCNSFTGRKYGTAYSKFALQLPRKVPATEAGRLIKFEVKDIYPLRVLKQMISMFLCLHNDPSNINRDDMDWECLKRFVLDPNAPYTCAIPEILFYILGVPHVPDSHLGTTIQFSITDEHEPRMSSYLIFDDYEIAFTQMGRYENTKGLRLSDTLGSFNFDAKTDMTIIAPITTRVTWLPMDTRSQEEVLAQIEKNKSDALETNI